MIISLGILRWVPVILVTGALAAATSVPGSALPDFLHHDMDKIAHAIIYGLLAASYLYGFGPFRQKFPYRVSLATGFICSIYGLTEEWYQQFVPGRVADHFDFQADIIGVLILISLWLTISRIKKTL